MRLNKYLFNTVNNKERGRGQRSVVWLKRGQPCLHHLHVLSKVFSWRPFSSFSLWIILLPHPSPLNSSTVKSVWQVPGPIGVGAHGWRARVCQPWGRNSVLGLAVPKVETLGHPWHPPPLSDAVVKFSYNVLSPLNDLLTLLFSVCLSLLITPERSLAIFVLCMYSSSLQKVFVYLSFNVETWIRS